jgi:hypothetical protein
MSLKSQLQYASGVNTDFLTEGIRFFRNSKRIEKLINKFQSALPMAKDTETRQDVSNYIRELQRAKLDFEAVEQKFSSGNKEEAKDEYKQLKIKFASIITEINKETVKKFMIIGGIAGLAFATFGMIIPSHMAPVQTPQPVSGYGIPAKSDLTRIQKEIQAQIQSNNIQLRGIRDKVKAYDLFDKNQKLIEKLTREEGELEKKIGQ